MAGISAGTVGNDGRGGHHISLARGLFSRIKLQLNSIVCFDQQK